MDQDLWIIRVSEELQMVEEIDEEEEEICMCIFSVPKELLVQKPEVYVPQSVSIGPYHHRRSDLHEMERYKLVAARRFQKRIAGHKFKSVVEEFTKLDRNIRSYYHKYLEYNPEALAWLMALDASFLLQCLHFYAKHYCDQTSSEDWPDVKKLGKVLDPTGRSSIHNQTLRDLMMLENQIPLFLLQKLLEMELGSEAVAEERLWNLVRLTFMELSPFKFISSDNSMLRINKRGHFLEVLYYSIVPLFAEKEPSPKEQEEEQQPSKDTTYITGAFSSLWEVASSLKVGFVRRLCRAVTGVMGPLMVFFKLLIYVGKAERELKSTGESTLLETPPTRDELDIPSVTDLHSSGIKFLPTQGDLTALRFDQSTDTLYLPQLKLDANTEVVLRNLVAFEASAAPGALFFTRYTDFMNGIIDSEEDVRLLRSSGIIYNHLENDEKVASLWNGMGKCVKLTRLRYLDQVIADVNTYYSRRRRWSVCPLRLLSFLAVAIFLLVACFQAFCSVYSCKKWFQDTRFIQD